MRIHRDACIAGLLNDHKDYFVFPARHPPAGLRAGMADGSVNPASSVRDERVTVINHFYFYKLLNYEAGNLAKDI
jgi:hypothetical protein